MVSSCLISLILERNDGFPYLPFKIDEFRGTHVFKILALSHHFKRWIILMPLFTILRLKHASYFANCSISTFLFTELRWAKISCSKLDIRFWLRHPPRYLHLRFLRFLNPPSPKVGYHFWTTPDKGWRDEKLTTMTIIGFESTRCCYALRRLTSKARLLLALKNLQL